MSTRNNSSNKTNEIPAITSVKEFLSEESLSRFRFAMSLFLFFAGFGLLLGDPSSQGIYDPKWIRVAHVSLICISLFLSFKFEKFKKYSELVLLFHFAVMSIHSFYLLYVNGLYLGYLFGLILVVFSTGVSINNRRVLIPVLLLFIAIAFFVGIHVKDPKIDVGMYYFGLISSGILSVLVIGFRMKTFETLLEADVQMEKIQTNMEEELSIAQKTQKGLVDLDFPEAGNFRIYSYFKPLESVGGDLIKTNLGKEGELDFFFADAAGHGVSAAMVSAMAVMAFKTTAPIAESPSKGLTMIHESLMTMIGGFFITAVYMRLDRKKKSLTYSYAGHHPAVLIKSDGSVQELTGKGTVLLALPKLFNRDYEVILESGDRVILFSDGMFEFYTEEKEFFGNEAFLDLIRDYTSLSGRVFLDSLGEAVIGLHSSPPRDDMTMLYLEVL